MDLVGGTSSKDRAEDGQIESVARRYRERSTDVNCQLHNFDSLVTHAVSIQDCVDEKARMK